MALYFGEEQEKV